MGKISSMDKVCFIISLALMLMCSAAQQQYFLQSRNHNWGDARRHCQACFKDLVTLTPENIRTIVQNLTAEYWIGLRKNFNSIGNSNSTSDSNSTGNFNSTGYFNSTGNSSDSSMRWSRWANGDPLTFQNWYPGWPVFKSSFPKKYCCSCSCTCPARPTTTILRGLTTPSVTSGASSFTSVTNQNPTGITNRPQESSTQNVTDVTGLLESSTQDVTDVTGLLESSTQDVTDVTGLLESSTQNVTDVTGSGESSTQNMTSSTEWGNPTVSTRAATTTTSPLPIEAECMRSPIVSDDPDPDENYIEDSCVAMLSFGAWVEKNCLELLPFICYDDTFFCQTNVTDVNAASAMLSWLEAPGDISHYRLEVKGGKNLTKNLHNLTYALDDLTPGTRYSVQVFPVKCDRDLNPQEVVFFTDPNKVQNLNVTNVTNTSVSLRWDKPVGNVDFYVIKVGDREFKNNTKDINITDLVPGTPYTFTVISGVEDGSKWSEESNITAYTRPGIVSNLKASDNTNNSLMLRWDPPQGGVALYMVKAMNDSKGILFNQNVTDKQTNKLVDKLPRGSRITLSVTVVVSDNLEGDTVTIISHTAPGPISNLKLIPTSNSLNVTWTAPPGNNSFFIVTLQLDGEDNKTANVTKPNKNFTGLKTAANYTVTVFITNKLNLSGPAVSASNFTLPKPPSHATACDVHTDKITFKWNPPENEGTFKYLVKLSSEFWSYSKSVSVLNQTSYTFTGLNSGTKYDFEVQVVAGDLKSLPANTSNQTVAEKREISLSMLCSSAKSLLCDNSSSRASVFMQLKEHFQNKLQDNIFWELEEYKTNN